MKSFFLKTPRQVAVPVTVIGRPSMLEPGQTLKIMSWNIQFCAGKDYVFFYDIDNMKGPDRRPSPLSIATTMERIASIIRDEHPDILLLQEVDHGARRTDYNDQFALLLRKLDFQDVSYTEAFYWQALFVPHPRIMGAVGMKLVTLSRYAMSSAIRLQLPRTPRPWYIRPFHLQHCLLTAELPVVGEGCFVVLNTHLEAFPSGTDIMERQIDAVGAVVDSLTERRCAWCFGGDFNLLPAGGAPRRFNENQRSMYSSNQEMARLTDRYDSVPSRREVSGPDAGQWFTHFPNGPAISGPDRTIDYLVYSPRLTRLEGFVRQADTADISDHFPVIGLFRLPGIDTV